MRRDVGILLATVVIGGAATVWPRVPEALSGMTTFRIDEVDVSGLRFLTRDSVVAQLALSADASVWGDIDEWTERITAHPLVLTAEVERRFPNALRITVHERRPVAFAAAPTLEPVDGEGFRLPIDPALHPLDLPILSTPRMPPDGSHLFPEDIRSLAAEVMRLEEAHAEFLKKVSTLRWDGRGAIVVRLSGPDVDFLVLPGASASRIREGEAALSDVLTRNPLDVPAVIDLRYAGQVVVRRTRQD